MTNIDKYVKRSLHPFRDWPHSFPRLFREMDEMMQNFMEWPDMNYRHAVTDWKTEDKKYLGTVELPGMKKEEIKINAIEGGLEIMAEHYEKKEDKGEKSESRRKFMTYERLPKDADLGNVGAAYDNGILTLNVPRLENASKSKGIEIKIQ